MAFAVEARDDDFPVPNVVGELILRSGFQVF